MIQIFEANINSWLAFFFGIFFVWLFRKNIGEMLANAQRLVLNKDGMEYERNIEEDDVTQADLDEPNLILPQGIAYDGYSTAFADLDGRVREYFDECERDNRELIIELKLMAVGMTYSLTDMIQGKIPALLRNYENAKIDLKILLIDADYLRELNLDTIEVDWAAKSQFACSELERLAEGWSEIFDGRLSFDARKYQNLPHWHGWLVNDTYLFMGRSNWNTKSSLPILTVGQNKYRYFDTASTQGQERIKLYRNWFDYYFKFASDKVCSTQEISLSEA